ncbi:MAG: serine/threonine-protein phosphatase [Synergistaceae bacterium]|nr:serine/threonine-protein phosphatase [Synergistaceae bacterium]
MIEFAARSETGNIRSNNEDNLFCNGIFKTLDRLNEPFYLSGVSQTPCIFAVFDGMGGEDCGETASLTAAETLNEHSEKILRAVLDDDANFAVNNYVTDSAKRLRDIMKAQRVRTGTTLALAVIDDDSFTAYNLGDSRIYRLCNNHLIRVTDDHTVAEDKVRLGMMTPAKAAKSRERHILTRCLGIYDDALTLAPDINGPFDVSDNRAVLICSDGLTDMLTHKELNDIATSFKSPSEIVNALTDSALANGGHDNITCIFVKFTID